MLNELEGGEDRGVHQRLSGYFSEVFGGRIHHGCWLTGSESFADALRAMEDLVVRNLGNVEGGRVLDIGCGRALLAKRIGETAACVIGVDAMDPGWAEVSGGKRVSFRTMRWPQNDFADASFDVVTMVECVEHMPDIRAALAEVARVLTADGGLLLATWTIGPKTGPVGWMTSIRRAGDLRGLRSWEETQGALRDSGFEIVAIQELGRQVAPTWTRCLIETVRRLPHSRSLAASVMTAPLFHLSMAANAVEIRLSYRLGWLEYRLVVARKPGAPQVSPYLGT